MTQKDNESKTSLQVAASSTGAAVTPVEIVMPKPQKEEKAKQVKKTPATKSVAQKPSTKQRKVTKKPAKSAKLSAKPIKNALRKTTAQKTQDFYDVSKLLTNPLSSKQEEKTMSNTKTQYEKLASDAQAMGRENVEAFVKSGSIWAKGCEQLLRESMTLAQSAAEKQSRFAKEAMACKTVNEFAEVQNKIMQANMDDFMAGATKISELSSKVLTDTAEPISKQAEKAIKKASEQMAA